jgi:hypothetical protein
MADDDQKDWVKSYHAALIELDRALLPEKIETAQRAIQQRINQLLLETSVPAEHLELEDALRNLRALQRETE